MKTTNQNTQIAERRELMKQVQKVVCFLLSTTIGQHNSFMYQAGVDYLTLYVKDAVFRNTIQHSRIFWAWWRNQWLKRDQQYLNSREKGETASVNLEDYLWMHNPNALAGSVHPNSIVLDESYAAMVGQVIEAEVCHG